MYPSSPRASLASRIWTVVSRPWAGVGIAMGVLTLATAGLVGTSTSAATPLAPLAVQTPVSVPTASVVPKVSIRDGVAQLWISLDKVDAEDVTVRAVVGSVVEDVVVPAGQRIASLTIPRPTGPLDVRLTSYDVLTLNGVASLP